MTGCNGCVDMQLDPSKNTWNLESSQSQGYDVNLVTGNQLISNTFTLEPGTANFQTSLTKYHRSNYFGSMKFYGIKIASFRFGNMSPGAYLGFQPYTHEDDTTKQGRNFMHQLT